MGANCYLEDDDYTLSTYVNNCPQLCSVEIQDAVMASLDSGTDECTTLMNCDGDNCIDDYLCPCVNSYESSALMEDSADCMMDLEMDRSVKTLVSNCQAEVPEDMCSDAVIEGFIMEVGAAGTDACDFVMNMPESRESTDADSCACVRSHDFSAYDLDCRMDAEDYLFSEYITNCPMVCTSEVRESVMTALDNAGTDECNALVEGPDADPMTLLCPCVDSFDSAAWLEDTYNCKIDVSDPDTVQALTQGCQPEDSSDPEEPEDTKQVKFDMKLSISTEEFNTHKETIKADVAELLSTDVSKVEIALKSRRSRRRLQDEVEIEVTVDAADESAATAIENTVNGDSFATDLGTSVSESTGLEVTVSGVTEASTTTITTEASDDSDDNNTTMIIIIVVVVVAVLLIGGFICYTMSNNSKLEKEVDVESKEVGGGEINEQKRVPGTTTQA